jgi:hypothetical protein
MKTQRRAFRADLCLCSVACGILCTSELPEAMVPTLELQRLFGRDHANLVAKQDDREQKQ